jgi:L-ascorbate metabolism protein UlaG (beta-lactamase superfamily)
LIIDPSAMFNFDEQFATPEHVVAVVITHEHFDHYGPENLKKIIAKNPEVKIFTSHDTAEKIAQDVPEFTNVTAVNSGDKAIVGQFQLDFFGGRHAHIIEGDDRGDNVGVVVNGQLVYAGDSFDFPAPSTITKDMVLALPTSGPWLKPDDSVKYLRAIQPAPNMALATHDALNDAGISQMLTHYFVAECEKLGAKWIDLQPADSIEV